MTKTQLAGCFAQWALVCNLLAGTELMGQQMSTNQVQLGMELSISTATNTFLMGDPIHLDFSLQSVSTNTVYYRESARCMSFDIEGPDGRQVSPTDLGRQVLDGLSEISNSGGSLLPRAVYTGSPTINDLFDMTKAGQYKITLSIKATIGPEGSNVWVRSTPLPVRIVLRSSL
jgi:hypothetical protein